MGDEETHGRSLKDSGLLPFVQVLSTEYNEMVTCIFPADWVIQHKHVGTRHSVTPHIFQVPNIPVKIT